MGRRAHLRMHAAEAARAATGRSRGRARPAARRVGLALAAICLLAGCSTFDRDWDAFAAAGPASAATDDAAGPVGRWAGIWSSDATGHGGGLRCIITRGEGDTLHARYRAKYGRWLRFGYAMPMHAHRDGDTYRFSAEADLGWLAGGVYEYDGRVTGDEFFATYASSSDRGTFRMFRVD